MNKRSFNEIISQLGSQQCPMAHVVEDIQRHLLECNTFRHPKGALES